jgi:redox-sensitive bicupin YhaK (pirin superfamily)
MISIRKASDRFHTRLDWLDSWHTFSFGEHFHPEHMGFRNLRVINEDTVAPRGGFPTHPHRDMEIISYVLDGELEHQDSLGNGSIIRPGEVQKMSAGTGVRHSEFNPSSTKPVHFLQIWIVPSRQGIAPNYQQKSLPPSGSGFLLVAAPEGQGAQVTLHQDVRLYSLRMDKDEKQSFSLPSDRHAWLQVAKGAVTLEGHVLAAGDGAAISNQKLLSLTATGPAEALFFELS